MSCLEWSKLFSGEVQKMKLYANCLFYGTYPQSTDEVEQHLTLTLDGRVSFSDYCFGNGEKYEKTISKNFKINTKISEILLERIQNYFTDEFDMLFATDVGSWELILTNKEGKDFKFSGSLCPIVEELIEISELFRQNLNMPELFMFDGHILSDRIEALKIYYHHITKIKPGEVQEDAAWIYRESIEIDRAAQVLIHTQNIGSGCKVIKQYYVEKGISALLDDLYSDELFSYIEGNDDDIITNPLESKDYLIEIDFQREGKRRITGSFDKNGLPEDFEDVAGMIQDFMLFYEIGEILDPYVYGKRFRKRDELIFCNVEFNNSGKTYCYLTDDESIEIGDKVVVPAGFDNKETVVEVESIEYHTAEEAPYPVDEIKRIIRKYSEGEE